MVKLYHLAFVSAEEAAAEDPNVANCYFPDDATAIGVHAALGALLDADLGGLTVDVRSNRDRSTYPVGTANVAAGLLLAATSSQHWKFWSVSATGNPRAVLDGLAHGGTLSLFASGERAVAAINARR